MGLGTGWAGAAHWSPTGFALRSSLGTVAGQRRWEAATGIGGRTGGGHGGAASHVLCPWAPYGDYEVRKSFAETVALAQSTPE